MTTEMTTKLLQEEVKSQSKLIKLLVGFYDLSNSLEEGDCLTDINSVISDIEKNYDLDMFRPKKDKDL